jgi:AraC-type DNA-binding domain-containing proteins
MDDRLLALLMAAWMERHLADGSSGDELAAASGYSENRLRQKFYNAVGETPAGYFRKRRLTEAARELMAGADIAQVALSYGYSSQDNFTTAFKAWFELNPGELRTMDAKYRRFLARMKEPLNVMELANLKQSGLNATLMGCVKGASDYLELDWSTPKLYGYSGHAFLINVHPELCPSAPYVWNHDPFYLALRNLGIRRLESVCMSKDQSVLERERIESRLKAHLDAGKLCIMDFLEHQLVAGYDSKGFIFLKPWAGSDVDSQLPALSFGSWSEALDREGWVQFTLFDKEETKADEPSLLASALTTALRMRSAPDDFAEPGYKTGDEAWATWIAGVDKGLGSSHGHWWTGCVWCECRDMAASFFAEIGPDQKAERARSLCSDLESIYRDCGKRLAEALEKTLPAASQKSALSAARELDRQAEGKMRELLAAVV